MKYSPEWTDLHEHEKVIEQGLATFIEVGWALLKIRDGKKYRAAGYSTFEEYCRERWQISGRRARQLVEASEVVGALESGTMVPLSERQARALVPLKDNPEAMAEAWEDALEVSNGNPTAATVRDAVNRISKPKLTEAGISHPARFSDGLIPIFAETLEGCAGIVLDPFAGTGRIHELQEYGYKTVGVEIEPEWADLHPNTQVGDATDLPFIDGSFDAICTSPTYGNRLADHHNASDPELRRSYTHDLGRPLHENNSGAMQWGDAYREFHRAAWWEAIRVLANDGLFILNIKDHVRDGIVQDVSLWHVATLVRLGLTYLHGREVVTPGLRQGENRDLRTTEWVVTFQKLVE